MFTKSAGKQLLIILLLTASSVSAESKEMGARVEAVSRDTVSSNAVLAAVYAPPYDFPPLNLSLDLKALGLVKNVWSDSWQIHSKNVLVEPYMPLADPLIRMQAPSCLFIYIDHNLMDSLKSGNMNAAKNMSQKEARIVVAPFKDRANAERFWQLFTDSIRRPISRSKQIAEGDLWYNEFVNTDMAVCFWLKGLWFTYIEVSLGITDGDVEKAETLRDRIKERVQECYGTLLMPPPSISGPPSPSVSEPVPESTGNSLKTLLDRKLSSKELLEDLDFIIDKIENKVYGRDPFNFVSIDEFDKAVQGVRQRIGQADSLSRKDFFLSVGPLLTLLKDDHATIRLHGKWLQSNRANGFREKIVMPLRMLISNRKCYVEASSSLPLKAQLISINGCPILDVVGTCLKHTDFSEYNAVVNGMTTVFDFRKHSLPLWVLYCFENSVTVRLVPYGETEERESRIDLLRLNDECEMAYVPLKRQWKPELHFDGNTAILNVPTFSLWPDTGSEGHKFWLKIFTTAFKTIDERKPQDLIIDISNNGGGSESVGDILLNYIYSDSIKVSFYSDSVKPDSLLKRLVFSNVKDKKYSDYEWPKFKGRVYLLISENTFSAAVRFADLIKSHKIGFILGRETKGFRSHYGEVKSYLLPHSGLPITVSSKFFVSMSGDKSPHGIVPDYKIDFQDSEDLFNYYSGDLLLEKAKAFVRHNG